MSTTGDIRAARGAARILHVEFTTPHVHFLVRDQCCMDTDLGSFVSHINRVDTTVST